MVQVVSQKVFNATCKKCGSALAYHYTDITKHKVNQDYLGDYDLVVGIKCPVCSAVIKHKNENRN